MRMERFTLTRFHPCLWGSLRGEEAYHVPDCLGSILLTGALASEWSSHRRYTCGLQTATWHSACVYTFCALDDGIRGLQPIGRLFAVSPGLLTSGWKSMAGLAGRVARVAERVAASLGVSLVPAWRLPFIPQRNYLRQVLLDWGITGVIDVGANAGQFADFLRRDVRFGGPILSIEPIPALARHLTARSTGTWRVLQCAVGRHPGSTEFHVTAGTEFSSILPLSEDSVALFGQQTDRMETLEVEIQTLDWIIESHRDWLGDRVYLKLDTQGYDLEALAGLQAQESVVVACQSEVALTPLYEGAPDLFQTIAAFGTRGFSVSQFAPNNGGHYPKLLELDCHFVKLKDMVRKNRMARL